MPTDLVAKSQEMRRLLELAERVAPTDATVLVTGESGTGKERLARFIHEHSKRSDGPFLAVDCGSLPESLLESELFGYLKGAFTGASADKQGLFEAARGGSIFLDEIGETSPSSQVRLLRVLQEHRIRPVGATKDTSVNVRVIAATNRDLERAMESGTFRKDLFFRLRVVQLIAPPLRQRREDLIPLAKRFIGGFCSEYACGPCSLSSDALDALLRYGWPGNVRELENAIERAVVLAEAKPRIELDDLPPEVRLGTGEPTSGARAVLPLTEVERRHIVAALEHFKGNRKEAAKALGIGETTLWRKLKSYGLVKQRKSDS